MERRERSLRGPNAQTATSSANGTGQLSVATTLPALTPAQMYSNFEEWIKMCTDNKVNATNSWNFALIDYFHEMTFIREGDSINFQKASCTLDGCVKIYTSRVDSVANETGKLLSGLADSRDDEDVDLRDENGEKRPRRRIHRSENTLLKDFSAIALKKFDLDFSVDPLFKKTSADFDEGGARGLLLNHLGIDGNCKIIFDASDATIETEESDKQGALEGEEDEDDEKEEENENENVNNDPMDVDDEEEVEDKQMAETENEEKKNTEEEDEAKNEDGSKEENKDDVTVQNEDSNGSGDNNLLEEPDASQSEQVRIEITRLKAKFPSSEVMSQMDIMPSLQGYDFFSENDTELPDPNLSIEAMNRNINNDNNNDAMDEAYDNYDAFDDYDMPDFDQGDDMLPNDDITQVDPFADDDDDENNGGQNDDNDRLDNPDNDLDNDDKLFQEQDFLTSIINSGEKDLYSYFDNTLVKNWAGPEHWKLRRVAPINNTASNDENASESGEKTRKRAAPRSTFQIEFIDGDDEDEDALFETSTKKTVTAKETATQKLSTHLLPDDIHFSSKQLLQYFLKPMFPNRPKRRNINNNGDSNNTQPLTNTLDVNGEGEPDIDFWAEQGMDMGIDGDYGAENQDVDIDIDYDLGTDALDGDQTMLTSFDDTSYYRNNMEYPDPETSALYGDALVTSQMKKTKPLYVNYARTAKRVDVKKLKDNLWKALTINTNDDKVQGIQKFTDIVHTLKRMYPAKVMQDISVPFCFICLLHLANEKDLSIIRPNQEEDDDFVLGETNNDWTTNESLLNEVTIMQN